MNLSKLKIGALLLLSCTTMAHATETMVADRTVEEHKIIHWGGVYAGLNTGYAYQMLKGGAISQNHSTLVNGGFIGANLPLGNVLVSIESSVDYYGLPNGLPKAAEKIAYLEPQMKRSFVAGGRLRVGYTMHSITPFVSGGVFVASDLKEKKTGKVLNPYNYGYSAGLGVDVALASSVFLRAEYRLNHMLTANGSKVNKFPRAGVGMQSHEIKLGLGLKY